MPIVIPKGIGADIGYVVSKDGKCYEITEITTDPVDTPEVDSIHSDCQDCLDNIPETCYPNAITPPGDVGCDQCTGSNAPPGKMSVRFLVTKGYFEYLAGVRIELVADGFCSWTAYVSGLGANTYVDLYLSGSQWILDVYDDTFSVFNTLTGGVDACTPQAANYGCSSCDAGNEMTASVSDTLCP